MKGFNLASMGQTSQAGQGVGNSSTLASSQANQFCSRTSFSMLNEQENCKEGGAASAGVKGEQKQSPMVKLARLARLAGAKKSNKNKWGNLIDAARSAKGVARIWNRSRSDDSVSSEGSITSHQVEDKLGSGIRQEKQKKTERSTTHPHSIINVTENELPEVLEESGIDGELSGRMATMDPIKTNTDEADLSRTIRCFSRGCDSSIDHVTLILDSSQPSNATPHYTVSALPLLLSASMQHDTADSDQTSHRSRTTELTNRALRDAFLMTP